MQSRAATPDEYVAELPADRRVVIEALRRVMRENLDPGFAEAMQYGMITFVVPHATFPAGYHCDPRQPLPVAGLAAQKNYYSVYIMPMWDDASTPAKKFRVAWEKTGRKLDMGKCCVRFKRLEDAALDVLGATLRAYRVEEYVGDYLAQLALRGTTHKGLKAAPSAPAKAAAKAGGKSAAPAKTPAKAASKTAAAKKPAAKKAAAKAKPAPRPAAAKSGGRAAAAGAKSARRTTGGRPR